VKSRVAFCQAFNSLVTFSDVKDSRPYWPRDQNFCLGLNKLASVSASSIWPPSCYAPPLIGGAFSDAFVLRLTSVCRVHRA